jgi:spore germination protein GerM
MAKPKHVRKRKGRGAFWVLAAMVIIAVLTGVYYLYSKGYFGDVVRASDTESLSETNLEADVGSKETDISNPAGSGQSVSETETATSGSDQHQESTAADSSIAVEEVKEETSQDVEKPVEENISVPNELDINIYFSDAQGEFLVGEKRHAEGDDIMVAVANELIKGPTLPDIYPTIPDGTVVRNVEMGSGIAYVNFSRELVVNHVKGAAAETMMVYSIVNTLTGIPGINAVQILVEGVKIKSIDGHIDISKPLTRNESILKK